METESGQIDLWPLAAYFGLVVFVAVFMLVSSHLLGERRLRPGTAEPYESGITPTGVAWIHFDIKYYLIAVFFVIFEAESIFVFAWAVSVRDVGWVGFLEMIIFIGLLIVALIYLWRTGGFDWGSSRPRGNESRRIGGR